MGCVRLLAAMEANPKEPTVVQPGHCFKNKIRQSTVLTIIAVFVAAGMSILGYIVLGPFTSGSESTGTLSYSENGMQLELNYSPILYSIFLAPLLETLIFNVIIQSIALATIGSKKVSIFLTALVFGLLHGPESISMIFAFIMGLFFCVLYWGYRGGPLLRFLKKSLLHGFINAISFGIWLGLLLLNMNSL